MIIDTSEWHPVTVNDCGGDPQVFAFCSTQCRERWECDEEA